ncbi:MAG: hypothetical protein QG579_432 [Patescibacteria group bacterium]|jgi:pheromone shutdown protein TraB|nr:hypothetical protein [Patescibacteria group bacterium]
MNNILSKDIIEDWGLGSLPPDKQADVVDRMGKMIYQAVLVRALDILSEKEQEEFDLVLDNDSSTPQDVLTFLQSKIPTFDQLVIEERNSLKQDLMVPAV